MDWICKNIIFYSHAPLYKCKSVYCGKTWYRCRSQIILTCWPILRTIRVLCFHDDREHCFWYILSTHVSFSRHADIFLNQYVAHLFHIFICKIFFLPCEFLLWRQESMHLFSKTIGTEGLGLSVYQKHRCYHKLSCNTILNNIRRLNFKSETD